MNRVYRSTLLGELFYLICYSEGQYLVEHKLLYYILSFTWGLPMTLVGIVVTIVLLMINLFLKLFKKKTIPIKRYHHTYYFEIGKYWGGLELGMMFIKGSSTSERTSQHELGHTYQNCVLGPFFPILVALPSAIRWWYRKLTPNKLHNMYDDIWFEECASNLGHYAVNKIK